MQRAPQRRRIFRRRPIGQRGYRSYGQQNWTAARRGTGRGAQGFLRRGTRIGQKTYATRTNLPEIKRKELNSESVPWETVGAGPTYTPVKGELFVPTQFQYWDQGIGMDKVTGTQVVLKNITGRMKLSFEDNGLNNRPWNFRLLIGFCKMGDFQSLEDTTSLGVNPFPEGVVLNYAVGAMRNHVLKVFNDSVGNQSGVLVTQGGVDTRQFVITGDQRFSANWHTESTIAGGDAVARPDIIRTFNWNCNKRLKLYPVSDKGSVAEAAADIKYAPVNDPRGLIPFVAIMCTNINDHPEAQEYMPTITVDATSYWTDC